MSVSIPFDVSNRCNDWQAITLLIDNGIVERVLPISFDVADRCICFKYITLLVKYKIAL